MRIPTYLIDTFTNLPFKGNPAGVCLLEKQFLSLEAMIGIAGELNASETAFLVWKGKPGHEYFIRYFTPAVEIDFCGHASFAAVHLLTNILQTTEVRLYTCAELVVTGRRAGGKIAVDFPIYDLEPRRINPLLMEAMGIQEVVYCAYNSRLKMILIEVGEAAQLRQLHPNFTEMVRTEPYVNEVVVTSTSDETGVDFLSRCFCPWIGINEDPVTGASHCLLGPYWGKKQNRKVLTACQCSRRGGYLELTLKTATELEICGEALTMLTGHIQLDE